MKRIFIILLLVLGSAKTVTAQNWLTDFSKAQRLAIKEKKPIILVFQGSDWCAPCIKLDRELWSTDVFKKYAENHYVMLQADFPRKKKNGLSEKQVIANAQLAERYNSNGIFPLIVVLDAKGTLLGTTSYKKTTPEQYIKEFNIFIK